MKVKTSPPAKPMEIKVKSADGKPKNIQITTLTSVPESNLVEPKAPEIKIRSADGKPKNIQFTTLATFTSPKSKGVQETSSPVSNKNNKSDKQNSENDKAVSEDDENKGKLGTPKSSKDSASSGTPKQTPKRIQLTTLQLYESPKQS